MGSYKYFFALKEHFYLSFHEEFHKFFDKSIWYFVGTFSMSPQKDFLKRKSERYLLSYTLLSCIPSL